MRVRHQRWVHRCRVLRSSDSESRNRARISTVGRRHCFDHLLGGPVRWFRQSGTVDFPDPRFDRDVGTTVAQEECRGACRSDGNDRVTRGPVHIDRSVVLSHGAVAVILQSIVSRTEWGAVRWRRGPSVGPWNNVIDLRVGRSASGPNASATSQPHRFSGRSREQAGATTEVDGARV